MVSKQNVTGLDDPQDLKPTDSFARLDFNRQVLKNAYEKRTAKPIAVINYFKKDQDKL
jgi:hypothetical protein